MKKIMKSIVAGTLLASTMLGMVGCATTPAEATTEVIATEEISQVIAFGDSLSDNGGAFKASSELVEAGYADAYIKPGELYWENRYSNGKTAVEIFAENLELPLTNYAVGGAMSGYSNYSDWMDSIAPTGVLGQIDQYQATLADGKADPNALYYIFVGTNDYCKFMDFGLEGTPEQVAEEVIANVVTAVERLAGMGAKKFFVVGSMDLALLPYEISVGTTDSAAAFTEHVNTQLPGQLDTLKETLQVEITSFDVTEVTDEIVSNPEQYGITVLDVECQPTWPEVKPAKENPEQYLFWDEWHYSATTHQIIGEAMYQAFTAK